MKRIIASVLLFVLILSAVGCGEKDIYVVRTVDGGVRTYSEMSDGSWLSGDYSYKWRLEITGRAPNAAKDTTYVYLSNVEDISFEKAMMASGLSSNTESYFLPNEALLVEVK